MSNPPQDPSSVHRLRARARVSGTVRPEVAEAIGQVERSLGDVARWEQALADAGGAPGVEPSAEPPPPGPPGWVSRTRTGAAAVPLVADDEGAEVSFRLAGAEEPTLLTEFAELPEDAAGGAVPPLWTAGAAGSPPVPPPPAPSAGPVDADLLRRRRNGRILSWAGVVLLVGVAALWLIPDRSADDGEEGQLPNLELSTSTTAAARVLDPLETTTVPTTASTESSTTVAGTSGSSTTATTRARSTTTTRAPATAPPATSGATTSTLGLPGRPCPAGCPSGPGRTTTTTRPPTTTTTTTTAPPTTTTVDQDL